MCLYKQDFGCVSGSKYAPKFWIGQISEYCRVLNMRMLHSILNMTKCLEKVLNVS